MLIITNRKINEDNFTGNLGNEYAFGDELDIDRGGQQKLRFAKANKTNSVWQVELIGDFYYVSKDHSNIKYPSFEDQYYELREKLVKENKNCVFFVHGFNQSFKKNLKKCLDIEKLHSVEVIMFSWPSNPMKYLSCPEYEEARKIAKKSANALNSIFTELDFYHKKLVKDRGKNIFESTVSFLVFSLGNYLFQESIQLNDLNSHPILFDNVILCQADVNCENHNKWGDKINVGKRVYATINQKDGDLKVASVCLNYIRLGETTKNLNCEDMTYIDFTDGEEIRKKHELFRFNQNKHVKSFFTSVLNGDQAEQIKSFDEAFKYSQISNCYEFRYDFREEYSTNR